MNIFTEKQYITVTPKYYVILGKTVCKLLDNFLHLVKHLVNFNRSLTLTMLMQLGSGVKMIRIEDKRRYSSHLFRV